MQLSQLFRRGIVIPLDQDAEDCLRAGNVEETTNVRFLPLDVDTFFTMWRYGLFDEINSRCKAMIDDYEDDLIEPTLLKEASAGIAAIAKLPEARRPENAIFLADIAALVDEARETSRPVVFVL